MQNKTEKIDQIAALCGMMWFMLIIDACFTWFMKDGYRDVIGFLFVIYATVTLSLNQGIDGSGKRKGLLISVFVLMVYMILNKSAFVIFKYLPFLCVISWRDSALFKMYIYFRKFVIAYAIISIVVEILVVTRIWTYLPCITIFPPQNSVQESLGYVNYFYGFFSIPSPDRSLTFYRACGPLMEGGHFVFFIGFVYLVEKGLFGKRNIWLVICGILTLSPNFVVLFLITESYCAIKQKRYMKPLLGIIGVIAGVILVFLLSPQYIKDEIVQIVYRRLLEESIENTDSEGLIAILDGRAGGDGLVLYQNFLKSGIMEKLTGYSRSLEGTGAMSDYRWFLMYCGYIGSTMVLWCSYKASFWKRRNLYGVCVLLFAMVVFVQRSWMFVHVYIWVMMLLTTVAFEFSKRNSCKYVRVSKKQNY